MRRGADLSTGVRKPHIADGAGRRPDDVRREPQMSFRTAAAALLALGLSASAAAAQDPDLIFKRSTVWKFLTPDHKLAVYAIDDPVVEGVACHFTLAHSSVGR